MVSHKVVLSRKVVLSWQARFRVSQVVSLRTSGGCGHGRNLGTVTPSVLSAEGMLTALKMVPFEFYIGKHL